MYFCVFSLKKKYKKKEIASQYHSNIKSTLLFSINNIFFFWMAATQKKRITHLLKTNKLIFIFKLNQNRIFIRKFLKKK